jgi:hypothetical protein
MSRKRRRDSWWERQQVSKGYNHNKLQGHAANRRGRHNEERVAAALKAASGLLPWVSSWRAATDDEDRQGIDYVVHISMDGGGTSTVYLQVKSSLVEADRFLRRNEISQRLPIAVIVVEDGSSDEGLLAQVSYRLNVLREHLTAGNLTSYHQRELRRLLSVLESGLKAGINTYGPIDKSTARAVALDLSVTNLRAWSRSILGVHLPGPAELREMVDGRTPDQLT